MLTTLKIRYLLFYLFGRTNSKSFYDLIQEIMLYFVPKNCYLITPCTQCCPTYTCCSCNSSKQGCRLELLLILIFRTTGAILTENFEQRIFKKSKRAHMYSIFKEYMIQPFLVSVTRMSAKNCHPFVVEIVTLQTLVGSQ